MLKDRAVVFLAILLAIALAGSAFACSSESEPEGENPPAGAASTTDAQQVTRDAQGAGDTQDSRKGHLVIGNLIDTSGPQADFGDAHRKAADLAAKHVTEAGGTPVTVVHSDTGSDSAKGVDAARELIQAENVAAIVGARSSEVTIAVAESVAVPDEVLLVSPSATSIALTNLEDKDFLFRTVVSDTAQGTVMATLAIGEDHETAGVMHMKNSYGQRLADQFTEVFEFLGGKVTGKVGHDDGRTSYTTELEQATTEDPDVFVAISNPAEAEAYLTELVQSGYTGKILLADAARSPEMVEAIGGDALVGTLGTSPATQENRSLKAFNTAYWEAYSEVPATPFLAQTYDTVILIALAAAKAGTITDSKAIRDALREVSSGPGEEVNGGTEGIMEALKLIGDGKDIDYEGVSGSLEFNESGDVNGTIEIWKIENGEIKSTGRFEFPYVPDSSRRGGPIAW